MQQLIRPIALLLAGLLFQTVAFAVLNTVVPLWMEKTKLAAVKPIGTRMSIGHDIKTGETYAEECGTQVRGQMSMEDYQKQEEESASAEGETEKTVVDFRAARQA